MKKFLLLSLTLLSLITVRADHIAGGEINWECIYKGPDKGKYIFTLRLFRYCVGIPLPSSVSINSNGPVSTIALNRISVRNIAPVCYLGNQISCSTLPLSNYAIEENVYKSVPVALTATPPTTGWTFYYNTCCRPDPLLYSWGNILDNLSPQNQSYKVAATLYPSTDAKPGECYDSSPIFAESPVNVFCTGHGYEISQMALDPDYDSLVYSLTAPLISSGTPVTYATHLNTNQVTPRLHGGNFIVPAPGFNQFLPLPWSHPNMNVLNQPLVVDPQTGTSSFRSYTRGGYAVGMKVDAYRKGNKIASVLRDIPFMFMNCAPDSVNRNPEITFNVPGKGTGLSTYKDTVYIGETIEFDIIARDSQLVDSTRLQLISLEALQSAFQYNVAGYPEIDTNQITWNDPVWIDSIEVGTHFSWNTSCVHLGNKNEDFASSRTFTFRFRATDDFCLVPGIGYGTVSITVLSDTGRAILMDSIIKTDELTDVLYWQPYTASPFSKYYIYGSTVTPDNFSLMDSVPAGTTTYTLNPLGPNRTYYYYVTPEKGPSPLCLRSEIYGDIYLRSNISSMGDVALDWDPVLPGDSANVTYEIYGLDANRQWTLIDGITGLSNHTDTAPACLDTLLYYVKALAGGNHFTSSWTDTLYASNVTSASVQMIHALADSAGNVHLKWDTLAGTQIDFSAYLLYASNDSTGPFNIVDTIWQQGSGEYLHLNAGADTNELFYYVKIFGYSDCLGQHALSKRSNILSTLGLNIADMGDGHLQLSWTPFFNKSKSTDGYYFLYKKYGSMSWSLLDSTLNEQYIDTVSICNENIYYQVTIDSSGASASTVSHINISGYNGTLIAEGDTLLIGPAGGINYSWYLGGSLISSTGNNATYKPEEEGEYSLVMILDNGCIVTTNTLTVVPPTGIVKENAPFIGIYPNPNSGTFDIAIEGGNASSLMYIELIDHNGKKVYGQKVNIGENKVWKHSINIQDKAKGLYLLKLSIDDTVYTKKVLFQ